MRWLLDKYLDLKMHSNSSKIIILTSLTALLPGCGNLVSYRGGDALKDIYATRVTALRASYGAAGNLNAAIEAAEKDQTGKARNDLLNDFIFLIDTNYNFWEKSTYNKKAFADFGSDFTSATLSTVSGIVTGGGAQGAKSILSFIAAGITSTKSSVNTDILQNQNLLAIIAKTRALRAEKLIPLQTGMYESKSTKATSLDTYSVEQGLNDLVAYYEAGTFVAALQDIIDKAGAAKTQSDSQVNSMKGIQNIPK